MVTGTINAVARPELDSGFDRAILGLRVVRTSEKEPQPPAKLTRPASSASEHPQKMAEFQIVKFKVGKTTFEIITKPGAALKYKKGQLGSVDNVLMSDDVRCISC